MKERDRGRGGVGGRRKGKGEVEEGEREEGVPRKERGGHGAIRTRCPCLLEAHVGLLLYNQEQQVSIFEKKQRRPN